MLFALPDPATDTIIGSKELQLDNIIINIVKILYKNNKWSHLLFYSFIYITNLAPEINFDLKASKELPLFDSFSY